MTEHFDFVVVALVVLAVVPMVVTVALVVAAFQDYGSHNDYTYIDLDGNAGSADVCGINRGGMWCKAADKRILVKEYTVIKEDE